MTLIAGFRCTDGFVIAGDTDIALGNTVSQSHKLKSYNGGKDHPYFIRIAIAGDEGYALEACQDIRDAVAALPSATFSEIKLAVRDVLEVIYHDQILPLWTATGQQDPDLCLILGVEDVNGQFGVLKTARNSIHEVDHHACAGTGNEVAEVLIERLFRGFQFSAATTEHLALQIFREGKVKGACVGGNTETISRRSLTGAPFFDLSLSKEDRRFLWGIDELIIDAVRTAIGAGDAVLTANDLLLEIDRELDEARSRIARLWADSHHKDSSFGNLKERHSTEYGVAGFGNPFKADLA